MMASAMCWARSGLPYLSVSVMESVYGSITITLSPLVLSRSIISSRSVLLPLPLSPITAKKLPLQAASYITSSVLQELLGVGSHLEGFFLRIDLDRLEVIRQKLTRLARCPACALERPNLRHPFL